MSGVVKASGKDVAGMVTRSGMTDHTITNDLSQDSKAIIDMAMMTSGEVKVTEDEKEISTTKIVATTVSGLVIKGTTGMYFSLVLKFKRIS